MEIVNSSFPNIEQVARGTAVNLLYRFGMQTARPFKVSDVIGSQGNPDVTEIKDLEGRPWLTSLALEADGKRFEFIECVITINQEKNIVTTPMQGFDGTVKEYVSDGDYSITINAAVNNYTEGDDTGASLEYPEDALQELIKILKLKSELICQSDFLRYFDIHWLVVKSFDLQQETHSNRQSINIQALSDRPLTYFKTEKDG